MSLDALEIRKAMQSDIGILKALADAHKDEIGFILRPALAKSIDNREVFVVTLSGEPAPVGFVDYHHRKDAQTTLYHIVVSPDYRGTGIGRKLVLVLQDRR
ncbi:MAG: GNAT family N-acetyltransferase [Anaerolineae bacterium]|uniref:GNAT family N-acetyltransferase n=1 Tax=Candidatus Amarolinea dominans TaxID=3140696 RepID=UPI003135B7B8|nr:GNAT family N-acetyltransferase [Anaerolineae bacterium]